MTTTREFPPAQYRAIVEHSPMMIWRSGPEGGRDYFNDTWLAFTGRTLEEELGFGWLDGVHPDDKERVLRVYQECFRRRERFTLEYRLCRHDGVYRWMIDRGVPFYDGGALGGYVGSVADIHERHEADTSKARFLAMLAHEQRTPLTSVQVFLSALRRQAARGEPPSPELLDRVSAQVNRLATLVQDLSCAARLGEGKAPAIAEVPVDLGRIARAVVRSFVERVTNHVETGRGHRFEFVRCEQPLWVTGDPVWLEQAVENIVDNAIKYSPRGGTIYIACSTDDGVHRLTVCDRGIGVPREELADVTRRYFRASNVEGENYPGIGMGLSLARDIVDRHGGRLDIASELGEGTRVTVSLPARVGKAVRGSHEAHPHR